MAAYLWTAAGGGDWNTAGNWLPVGVPGLVSSSDVASLISSSSGLSSFTVTVGTGETFSLSTVIVSAQGLGNEVGLTIEDGAILTTGTLALSDGSTFFDHINVSDGGTLNIVSKITSASQEDIDIGSTGVTAGGHLEFGSATLNGTGVNDTDVTFNFLDNPAGEQSDGVIEYLSGFVSGSTTTLQNISGVSWGDGFIFDGADFTGDTATLNGSTLTVTSPGTILPILTMDNINAAIGTTFVASGDEILAVCYGRGTMIQTPAGERPVETLRPGMQVVTLVDGNEVPRTVNWVGHRRINLTRHPRPETVAPIRIIRDAFADNVPHTDLLLSPDHAVFVDGMLICIRLLVNGSTIRTERGWTAVDYYHVELNDHGILLAEGLTAESYLDTGNRGFFANSAAPLALFHDMTDKTDRPTREVDSCAPFVWDEPSVQPVWQRLAERAATLGQPVRTPATTLDPSLCVIANGRTIRPLYVEHERLIFVLPTDATEVRMVSRAALPTEAKPWLEDRRRLGVYVKRIVQRRESEVWEVPLDHPTLLQGWWAVEHAGSALRRWTNGEAVISLPASDGPTLLEVHLAYASLAYPIERLAQVA